MPDHGVLTHRRPWFLETPQLWRSLDIFAVMAPHFPQSERRGRNHLAGFEKTAKKQLERCRRKIADLMHANSFRPACWQNVVDSLSHKPLFCNFSQQ